MASILILGVKVPFTSGGQEALVHTLKKELVSRGHLVDVAELPYHPLPKEGLLNQCAHWRSIDFTSFAGQKVDLVIATKFPSYFAKHPRKSLWLVHQHRAIYDLYGTRFCDFSDDPRDEALRRMLMQGDQEVLGECAYRSGISKNVVERLKKYNGLDAEALYPPLPLGNRYKTGTGEPYILSVGRLCSIKRVDMVIKALPIVHGQIRLKIVGSPDEPGIMEYFTNEIAKHHLSSRIDFLGRVSDEELINLYSKAFAVYYAPYNEDYGYVTLEAFASGKPVLTASDSGGVLEFVRHQENGLIVEPTADSIGHGVNKLFEDLFVAQKLGAQGRRDLEGLGLHEQGWDKVVNGLLTPLQ